MLCAMVDADVCWCLGEHLLKPTSNKSRSIVGDCMVDGGFVFSTCWLGNVCKAAIVSIVVVVVVVVVVLTS